MEIVNEWSPTGKYRNIDTRFRTNSAYKNELTAALPLTGHALNNTEMEYHEKLNILLEGYNTFLL